MYPFQNMTIALAAHSIVGALALTSVGAIDAATATINDLRARGASTLTGAGPTCTAVISYSGNTANVNIEAPNGTSIGGSSDVSLPSHGGWANIDSLLPYGIVIQLDKKDITVKYSNDISWTVDSGAPSSNGFDCRQFKFWLITNFWVIEDESKFNTGTLNWTITTLDGTVLGGSPQDDILMSLNNVPATVLTSELDDVVKVYWALDNSMAFDYGTQTVRYANATGPHASLLTGSAPMNVFSWITSGIL